MKHDISSGKVLVKEKKKAALRILTDKKPLMPKKKEKTHKWKIIYQKGTVL